MEIDATQSRLEAGILRNELLQARTDLHNAFSGLSLLTGSVATDTLYIPDASMHLSPRDFVLADLISTASMNRTDLVAALKNKEVAARALKATRRERNTDVDLSIAVSKNSRVRNEEAPAPPPYRRDGRDCHPVEILEPEQGSRSCRPLPRATGRNAVPAGFTTSTDRSDAGLPQLSIADRAGRPL